jgi:multidrug efflux pump
MQSIAGFTHVARGYQRALSTALAARWLVHALGAGVLIACWFLYTSAQRELAPQEDQGFLMMQATADPQVSLGNLEYWTHRIGPALDSFDAIEASLSWTASVPAVVQAM